MQAAGATDLGDGLVLRAASAGDVDQIVTANVDAFGAQDGPDVRWFLEHDPGLSAWTVVADGDRIVSSIGGLPFDLEVDGVRLPGYQIEYVVTGAAHQRRGLVRRQVERHHERAAVAGALFTTIGGIPYFYRRFGYGYGLDHPRLFVFDPAAVVAPSGGSVHVRDATNDDVDALVTLEDLRRVDLVRSARDRRWWQGLVGRAEANPHASLLVAERDGALTGWAPLLAQRGDHRVMLFPSLAADEESAAALLAAADERSGDDLLVAFDEPSSAFGEHLRAVGSGFELGHGFFVRMADPVAVLDRLRPVLSARLAASELASERGALEVSLYVSGVRIHHEGGEVVGVERCPPVEDPLDGQCPGVPPDWFPALVLGRWGASGLASRVDDVLLGRDRRLMDVLFPARDSDVAGEY